MNPKELKKQIVQVAVDRALQAHQVPGIQLLNALKEISKLQKENREIMRLLNQERKEHSVQTDQLSASLQKRIQDHERQASDWKDSVNHLLSIPHLKGDPGKPGKDGNNADPVDIHELARIAATHVQFPEQTRVDAKDINADDLYDQLLARLKKDKSLTISDLKDGQGFIFNGKKYKTEELMHGASTSNSGGGNNIYGEIVDGSGTSWTLSHAPVSGTFRLYANGQRLTVGVDYSETGVSITTVSSWAAGTLLADYSYT